MPNLETALSPEAAQALLDDDLLPRLNEQIGQMFPLLRGSQVANPYLEGDFRYHADGSVEGITRPLLSVAGFMSLTYSHPRNLVPYKRSFNVNLWKGPEDEVLALGLTEHYVGHGGRQEVTNPELK
jgi:hypothetical protein